MGFDKITVERGCRGNWWLRRGRVWGIIEIDDTRGGFSGGFIECGRRRRRRRRVSFVRFEGNGRRRNVGAIRERVSARVHSSLISFHY